MLLLGCATSAYTQVPGPDTILILEDVNIISDRLSRFAKGQMVHSLDTLTRRENPTGTLSELLPGFTSAYVRNYGQGTLVTLSIRGTSANHSGILWNGVRLSPPNIGYLDLSLIQGNFFQEVSVLFGGASPMFGSGAIGGGIHLNNRPVFDSTRWEGQMGLSAGSYANLLADGKLNFISPKFYSHTSFSINGAKNNFSFENLYGEPEKLDHAGYFKGGFLQDIAVKLAKGQYLMASAWFQYAGREIPATMTEAVSEAEQLDRSWRSMMVWKDFNRKNTLEAKASYFNEFTRYLDPKAEVYSVIRSQTGVAAFESTWDLFKNASLFAGANYTYEYADLDYYVSPEHQQSLALYLSWMHEFPALGWQVSLNARQEFFTGYDPPFLFSLGSSGKIWKFISGRISFSRNFRAPTLNERYWQPGGDPDLEPEASYNLEAGISLKPVTGNLESELSVTGFSSWVDNWILWQPGSGGTWSVENAQEVWSRGLEISINEIYRSGAAIFMLYGSYSMTFSTNEKKLSEYDESYHKQLIYTPVHRMILKPGFGWKGFQFTLRGSLSGLIYTSRDNEESLPSYFLLDAIISKSIWLKSMVPLSFQVNLNNITDLDYQVVPYRPMPGFNVMGTVVVKFAACPEEHATRDQRSAVRFSTP